MAVSLSSEEYPQGSPKGDSFLSMNKPTSKPKRHAPIITEDYTDAVSVNKLIPKARRNKKFRRIRKDREYYELMEQEKGIKDEW